MRNEAGSVGGRTGQEHMKHAVTLEQLIDAKIAYEIKRLEAVARRYEYVRRLNVPEFKKLFVANLTSGISFDTLVDNAIAESKL